MMQNHNVTYVVLAHQDPRTLNFLLSLLHDRRVLVCVPQGARLSPKDVDARPSHVVRRSAVRARWGGFSLVRLTLDAISMAMREFGEPDQQIVLLSGQCVPVRPIADFEDWLFSTPMRVIANSVPLTSDARAWSLSSRRLSRRYFFDAGMGALLSLSKGRVHKAIKRIALRAYVPVRHPDNLPAFAGSQWISLPFAAAKDLLRAHEAGELSRYHHIFAPDEVALQTWLRQSRWSRARRVIETSPEPRSIAEVANFHYLRTSMAGYLTVEELQTASAQGFYFARKVSVPQDARIASAIRLLVSSETP
ncbi:beta-1,6-N-acetylglucosaminyltransferase [Microbacterium sp. NPDC055312]